MIQTIQQTYSEANNPTWSLVLLCGFKSPEDFRQVYADCLPFQSKETVYAFLFPAISFEDNFPPVRERYLPLVRALSADVGKGGSPQE